MEGEGEELLARHLRCGYSEMIDGTEVKCEHKFRIQKSLNEHFLTEHVKRVFKCKVDGCEGSFKQKEERIWHYKQKHPKYYNDEIRRGGDKSDDDNVEDE